MLPNIENSGGRVATIADKLIAEGKAEGMTKGRAEIAQGLLKEGISIEVISKTTGLSIEEIERLRS